MTCMANDDLRKVLYNEEFQQDVSKWIIEELAPALQKIVFEKARDLKAGYDIDLSLAALHLSGQTQKFMRSFSGWMAAETRYDGATLQEIADVLGFASNSHVKRSWPELDDVVDTIARVQKTGKPEGVTITDHYLAISPDTKMQDE